MIASVDTTFGQFAADATLIAILAVNVYLGWRYGLMRRIVGFAGLYLGCLAATNVGNAVAGAVHAGSVDANAWAFLAVLIVVVVAVEVLGFLFNDMLQQIAVIIFDRLAGVVAGVAVGIAEALVIFLVAYAVAATPAGSPGARSDRAGAADAIQSATFAGLLVHMTPPVHAMLSAVIPNDLATHLSEGTRADTTRA